MGNKKLTVLDALSSVPGNALLYVVLDGVSYKATKDVLLHGLSSMGIQVVLNNGNEIVGAQQQIFTDTDNAQTIIDANSIQHKDLLESKALIVNGNTIVRTVENGAKSVSIFFDDPTGETGAGSYRFRNVGDLIKTVAWKEEVDLKADLIDGKVPAAQLPVAVDEILEGTYINSTTFNDESSNPYTPVSNKYYLDLTTNKTYRWSGTVYTAINEGIALGETSSTAYRGDRGKTAYDHSQESGNPHNSTLAQLGFVFSNISETSTIVGFSDYTMKNIQMIETPDMIMVTFQISGTSNATSLTFTLPVSLVQVYRFRTVEVRNNGALVTTPALTIVTGNVVQIYNGTTTFTASGVKSAYGSLTLFKN